VLTNDALDPDVLIPEFKVCAVEILPLKKKAGKEVAAGVK